MTTLFAPPVAPTPDSVGSAYDHGRTEFERILDRLELEGAARDLLRTPLGEYRFQIPMRMDNGVADAYRLKGWV